MPAFKCLNPQCRHDWNFRGQFARSRTCPRCRRVYVIDWDTYRRAVTARMDLLKSGMPGTVLADVGAKGDVIAQIFPQLPFNAFAVIDEEAQTRHSQGLPPP